MTLPNQAYSPADPSVRRRRFLRLLTAPEVPEEVRPTLVRVVPDRAVPSLWRFTRPAAEALASFDGLLRDLSRVPWLLSRMSPGDADFLASEAVRRGLADPSSEPAVLLRLRGRPAPSELRSLDLGDDTLGQLFASGVEVPGLSKVKLSGHARLLAAALDPDADLEYVASAVTRWVGHDSLHLAEWLYRNRVREVFLSDPSEYPRMAGALAATVAPFDDPELCRVLEGTPMSGFDLRIGHNPFVAAVSEKFADLSFLDDPSGLVETISAPGWVPSDNLEHTGDLASMESMLVGVRPSLALLMGVWAPYGSFPGVRTATRRVPVDALISAGDPWAAAKWEDYSRRVSAAAVDWETFVTLAKHLESFDDALEILE